MVRPAGYRSRWWWRWPALVLAPVGRCLQAFGTMYLGLAEAAPTAPPPGSRRGRGVPVTGSPADPSAALNAGASGFTGPPPAHPERLPEPGELSEAELRLARELWPSRYR